MKRTGPARHPLLLNFWRVPLLLAITITVLDQVTKHIILRVWPDVGPQKCVIIPNFFHVVHFRNTGAAWGIFAQHTNLLSLISVIVLFLLVYHFRGLCDARPERALAIGMIVGGTTGNLIDRIGRGGVIDFLFFFWDPFFHWPAFNLADSGITVGVTVFVVSSVVLGSKEQIDEQGTAA